MALSIKDEQADYLARQLSRATGESLTVAVQRALRERLARVERQKARPLAGELLEIAQRCAEQPLQDARSAEAILGYDEHGLPR